MRAAAAKRLPVETSPAPVDRFDCAKELQEILNAVGVPLIDAGARDVLHRILRRDSMLRWCGPHVRIELPGRDRVVLLLRAILESEGNEGALIAPIVSAVAHCLQERFIQHGVDFIAAFDHIKLLDLLQTLRGLNAFDERSIPHHLAAAIINRLKAALPCLAPAAAKFPDVEGKIELARKLLVLSEQTPNNAKFEREARRQFNIVDRESRAQLLWVARRYAERPEIYRRLSWTALHHLASPHVSDELRTELEQRVLAGERVSRDGVMRARGPSKPGTPRTTKRRSTAPTP